MINTCVKFSLKTLSSAGHRRRSYECVREMSTALYYSFLWPHEEAPFEIALYMVSTAHPHTIQRTRTHTHTKKERQTIKQSKQNNILHKPIEIQVHQMRHALYCINMTGMNSDLMNCQIPFPKLEYWAIYLLGLCQGGCWCTPRFRRFILGVCMGKWVCWGPLCVGGRADSESNHFKEQQRNNTD